MQLQQCWLTFCLTAPSRASVQAGPVRWETPGLFQQPAGRILAAPTAAGPTRLAVWGHQACDAHTSKAAAPPSRSEGTGGWWVEWPASWRDEGKWRCYRTDLIKTATDTQWIMQMMQQVRNSWMRRKRCRRQRRRGNKAGPEAPLMLSRLQPGANHRSLIICFFLVIFMFLVTMAGFTLCVTNTHIFTGVIAPLVS